MSKKNNSLLQISARIGRVERKCNRLIAEVSALRKALTPQPSEIDAIIGHLPEQPSPCENKAAVNGTITHESHERISLCCSMML